MQFEFKQAQIINSICIKFFYISSYKPSQLTSECITFPAFDLNRNKWNFNLLMDDFYIKIDYIYWQASKKITILEGK